MQLKTALKTIAMKYRPGFVLTPHQNILLTDLQESTMDEIERVLTDHGVTPFHDLSAVRRHAMACPALPTCGLAMAESERLMPTVVDRFEAALTSLGLRNEPISMRMTGCPNGCARPYTADIAFVGRRPDVYHVYVGGGMAGNRVVDLYATDIATEELVNTLHPLLSAWASRRQPGEGLSDFYRRLMGHTSLRQEITGREEPTQPLIQLSVSS